MDINIDFEQLYADQDQSAELEKAFAEAFQPAALQVRVGSADLLSGSAPSKTGRCC